MWGSTNSCASVWLIISIVLFCLRTCRKNSYARTVVTDLSGGEIIEMRTWDQGIWRTYHDTERLRGLSRDFAFHESRRHLDTNQTLQLLKKLKVQSTITLWVNSNTWQNIKLDPKGNQSLVHDCVSVHSVYNTVQCS